jgi:hypothetical protein
MRKLASWIAPLVLLLAAAAVAPALAGEAPVAPAAVAAPAAAPVLCPAAPAAQAQRGTPLAGLAPEPLFAAICTVQCVNTSCRRDSDCTAAPNGSCVFACPKVGCCSYPLAGRRAEI